MPAPPTLPTLPALPALPAVLAMPAILALPWLLPSHALPYPPSIACLPTLPALPPSALVRDVGISHPQCPTLKKCEVAVLNTQQIYLPMIMISGNIM